MLVSLYTPKCLTDADENSHQFPVTEVKSRRYMTRTKWMAAMKARRKNEDGWKLCEVKGMKGGGDMIRGKGIVDNLC